jgi:hypothetical protein
MDDNLMPNDGTFFGVPTEPEDQIVARKKERAATLEAKQEIDKVIERLNNRIEATDSVRQALKLAVAYGCSRDEALIALDVVRQQLEEERLWLSDLLEVHAKNL